MAILLRRGNSEDYDASKMEAGEIAVVIDTKQAFVSFQDGSAEELAQKKYLTDIEETIDEYVIPYINDLRGEADELHSDIEELGDSTQVVPTVTGDTIALSDSSDRQLRGLTIYGKTTQDGTPSPTNPIPLVSSGDIGELNVRVCGKNLFDINSPTKQGYVLNADGSFKESVSYNCYRIPVKDSLVVSFKKGADFDAFRYGKEVNGVITRSLLSGKTSEIIRNCDALWVSIIPQEKQQYDVQVEYGTAATPYEPYAAQTLTIQTPNGLLGIPVTLGGNYTDENGQQWVCDEIDFERGVYVQRITEFEVNSTNVSKSSAAENLFIVRLPSAKAMTVSESYIMTTAYSRSTAGTTSLPNYTAHAETTSGDQTWLRFKDNRYSTLEDMKNALANNPITVIYPLATPIETPLTAEEIAAYKALHSNKPTTTILNDGGAGMAISYVADTKAYIDNKFAALEAAILSTGGNV